MTARKITRISAVKLNAPVKPADLDARMAWIDQNHKSFELRGYWEPVKAMAYAAKRGYVVEEIEHRDLGIDGKEWSQGVDHKFAVIKGKPVAVNHE